MRAASQLLKWMMHLYVNQKSDYDDMMIEMYPHFLRNNYSVLAINLVTSLCRNDSTFLKKTTIQSGPKIWLYL